MTYRDEVKVALIEKKMSQRQLAKLMNISIAYLSDILAGHRKAPERRKQISEILDIKQKDGSDC